MRSGKEQKAVGQGVLRAHIGLEIVEVSASQRDLLIHRALDRNLQKVMPL